MIRVVPGAPILYYWAVWCAALLLPRFVCRDLRSVERWEIPVGHPGYERLFRIYPWVTNVFGLTLAGLVFWMFFTDTVPDALWGHLLGLLYGGILLVDAAIPWFTGIRPIPASRPARYVLDERRTWRTKLQLAVAAGYCLAALLLLLSRLG